MRNFQKKTIWRDIMQSKPVLGILAILILIFAWSVLGFWNKMEDTIRNKKVAEGKVSELQDQKLKLSADINSLKTDEGKEKIFRENYGLSKDGEDMIVVVEDKNKPLEPLKKPSFFSSLMFWKKWFK